MTKILYSKVSAIDVRRAAWRESSQDCRACAYWRHGPMRGGGGYMPDAVCQGHAKAKAQIDRDEKGLPPPTFDYEFCPEHGCKIDKDGSCAGCESPLAGGDYDIFHADVGDR